MQGKGTALESIDELRYKTEVLAEGTGKEVSEVRNGVKEGNVSKEYR